MTTRIAIALLGTGLVATASHATLTPISAPPAGELTHEEIIDLAFGDLEVTRVDDDDDQIYDIADWEAELIASYASAGQGFGTFADGPLVSVAGPNAGLVDGLASGFSGSNIKFARFGSEFATLDVTTDPTDNGGIDHVVTYTFETDEGRTAYLLFFEDQGPGIADFDYNDLVVQVTVIPEPSSLALLGLGGLLIARRRRG